MIIDVIFAILLISAVIKGFSKGLIMALFSLIAFIVGLAAALKLSALTANYLKDSVNVSAKWLPFISFLIIFIIVILLVRLCAKFIEKTAELVLLGWANRLGGIIFYLFLYTLIFSVLLFYADKISLLSNSTISASRTYSIIQPVGPMVINNFGKILPVFKDTFAELENFFDGLSH